MQIKFLPGSLLAALLLLGLSTPLQADRLRLERTAIIDGTGFAQPMIAATLFKPFGWKESGGIVWGNPHACTQGWGVNWAAESADSTRAIAVLPQQSWEQNSEGRPTNFDCPLMQLNGIEDYLREMLKSFNPDSGTVQYRTRPDMVAQNPLSNQDLINNGFNRQSRRAEAGEVVFNFSRNGLQLRGSLATLVVITETLTGGEGYGIGPPIRSINFDAQPVFAFYTPVNKFNPSLYEGLRRSIVADQQWIAQISQHGRKMGRINRKGAFDRSQITAKVQAEIAAISHRAWQSGQRSADARASDFVNTIREVQNYSDTTAPGGQVELSNQYNHAWQLQDGSYVLTDNPNFQPQQSLGVSGQLLAPVR